MEKQQETELTNMVQSSAMLLTFEGWIKYIEGFSRGLQTTKTVDATQVFDCVGEIMEYMKQLKGQIVDLFVHCEEVLEKEEVVKIYNEEDFIYVSPGSCIACRLQDPARGHLFPGPQF